jgi:hypothetical protein
MSVAAFLSYHAVATPVASRNGSFRGPSPSHLRVARMVRCRSTHGGGTAARTAGRRLGRTARRSWTADHHYLRDHSPGRGTDSSPRACLGGRRTAAPGNRRRSWSLARSNRQSTSKGRSSRSGSADGSFRPLTWMAPWAAGHQHFAPVRSGQVRILALVAGIRPALWSGCASSPSVGPA